MRMNTAKFFLLPAFCFLFSFVFVQADEYSSDSFNVSNPVINTGGSFSSSTSFQILGAISQLVTGTSTSVTFGVNPGFFYFPFASSPVATAVAGNGQVSLSWSLSQGYLGWNVSGYNVGQSTAPGGPYSYSASLGSGNSSTRTGLTNGTKYYFVIRAEDAFGNSVATSTEVSSTPVAPTAVCGDGTCNGSETCSSCAADCGKCITGGGGGGGGGGGAPIISSTKVILKGMAYPGATINILKDGSVVAAIQVGTGANFEREIAVAGGLYTFSVFALDIEGRRSLTFSFTVNVPSGIATTISDIILSPTIGADKSQVKFGNDIKFFGYSYPQSQINVIINSKEQLVDKTNSDRLGYWAYDFNSGNLEMGDHTTKSQAVITPGNLNSPLSEALIFRIGDQDIAFGKLPFFKPGAPVCSKKGDINNDGKVNIVDFSILLYFWNKKNPSNACVDLNGDGAVNLFDFSIMLYWWTG